jgi:hypothetical protein
MRWLALALLVVSACAHDPPPAPPSAKDLLPPVPDTMTACPLGGRIPPLPPAVRTTEALGAYLVAIQHVALDNEHARAVCAREYQKLRDWLNRAGLL